MTSISRKAIGQGSVGAVILTFLAMTLVMPARAANILLVGDSHMAGEFGGQLDAWLRTIPNSHVAMYASCGSTVTSWFTNWETPCGYRERLSTGYPRSKLNARTPLFERLKVGDSLPDFTIIALGSNSYGAKPSLIEAEIRRMVTAQKKKGGKCVWIGPPDVRTRSKASISSMYAILGRVLNEPAYYCQLIDSRKYTAYPSKGGDGMHYSYFRKLISRWVDGVKSELADELLPAKDAPIPTESTVQSPTGSAPAQSSAQ